MRAEAKADVEGLVEVQGDGRSELVHGFAFETEEDGKGVAFLFEANALGDHGDKTVGAGTAGTTTASDAELQILDASVFLGPLCEVNHAGAMQGDDGFFGVVVEVLADDEEGLAITITVGIG